MDKSGCDARPAILQLDCTGSAAEVIPKVNSESETEIPVACLCINKEGKNHGMETAVVFLKPGWKFPAVTMEADDMRSVRMISSLPLLLLLAFPWACAQDPPPRLEVFLQGGGSFLNGSSGQLVQPPPPCACPAELPCLPCSPSIIAVTSSFTKTARLFVGGRLRLTRHDALEGSYSYSPTQFTLQPVGLQAFNRNDLVTFNYVRYLWTKTRVQPFVTAGLGFNRFSGPSSSPAAIAGYVYPDNGRQFAWNYGGGADIVFQRHLVLRMELRDYVTKQPTIITGSGLNITGTVHNVVPSVGIVFRFM